MKKKYYRGEIAQVILGTLIGATIGFGFAVAPGLAYIFKLFDAHTKNEKSRIRQSLANLRRRKCIHIYTNKKGEKIIKLTGKGYQQVMLKKLDELKTKNKNWDKIWHIVIFDIPEKKKVARNSIHRKLKELNFYPLQKSTFIYPYDCGEEINFLGHYYKVRKHICYIKSNDVENDEVLKKHFAL